MSTSMPIASIIFRCLILLLGTANAQTDFATNITIGPCYTNGNAVSFSQLSNATVSACQEFSSLTYGLPPSLLDFNYTYTYTSSNGAQGSVLTSVSYNSPYVLTGNVSIDCGDIWPAGIALPYVQCVEAMQIVLATCSEMESADFSDLEGPSWGGEAQEGCLTFTIEPNENLNGK